MLRILMLTIVFTLAFSCGPTDPNTPPSNVKVYTAGMIANGMSTAIISTLSCANTDLVKSDVKTKVDAWFGLPQNKDVQKGILGSVCSATVSAILPMIFGSLTAITVKPEWQCTGKNVSDVTTKIASLACAFIPI